MITGEAKAGLSPAEFYAAKDSLPNPQATWSVTQHRRNNPSTGQRVSAGLRTPRAPRPLTCV